MSWAERNPVLEAEFAAVDCRPVIGECEVCKCDIHGSDDHGLWEKDDAYLFDDGSMVCGDCLREYCNEHFRI